jgi:predicted acylesterase/phospholipase RssA
MSAALTEKEEGRSVFAGFMGTPRPFSDEEITQGALRRMLEAIDFKFLFDRLEKKLDDQIARALAGNERFRHVLALVERGGWFAADRFVTWLQTRLDSGTFGGTPRRFSALTLAQLFAATGVELSVVAADTADAKILVLNHRTAPECPVVWAVRMSMSIPLVWEEVIWQPGWGPYLGRDVAGHAIVDGGLLSNFPIELFISGEPQVVKLMGPKQDTPVLGMLIDERLPVPLPKGLLIGVDMKLGELRTIQRLQRLVDTATTAHDKMVIEEYAHLVVRLPAQGYGTTEFDMSDGRRTALVAAGKSAMAEYLDRPAGAAVPKSRAADGRAESPADRIAKGLLE